MSPVSGLRNFAHELKCTNLGLGATHKPSVRKHNSLMKEWLVVVPACRQSTHNCEVLSECGWTIRANYVHQRDFFIRLVNCMTWFLCVRYRFCRVFLGTSYSYCPTTCITAAHTNIMTKEKQDIWSCYEVLSSPRRVCNLKRKQKAHLLQWKS